VEERNGATLRAEGVLVMKEQIEIACLAVSCVKPDERTPPVNIQVGRMPASVGASTDIFGYTACSLCRWRRYTAPTGRPTIARATRMPSRAADTMPPA
jgi:hypothetical protein